MRVEHATPDQIEGLLHFTKHLQGQHDQKSHGRQRGGSSDSREQRLARAGASLSEERRMLGELIAESGFTMDPLSLRKARQGIAVAMAPGASLAVPLAKLTPQVIAGWQAKHAKTLALPGIRIGGWVDRKTNKAWLDIVKVFNESERSAAIAAGKAFNQIAVYDIRRKREIRIGGTGVAKAASGRVAFFLFDPDEKPEAIAARMRGEKIAKHLPGQHDQKSHGRKGTGTKVEQRTLKPKQPHTPGAGLLFSGELTEIDFGGVVGFGGGRPGAEKGLPVPPNANPKVEAIRKAIIEQDREYKERIDKLTVEIEDTMTKLAQRGRAPTSDREARMSTVEYLARVDRITAATEERAKLEVERMRKSMDVLFPDSKGSPLEVAVVHTRKKMDPFSKLDTDDSTEFFGRAVNKKILGGAKATVDVKSSHGRGTYLDRETGILHYDYTNHRYGSIAHELGHFLEDNVPGMHKKVDDFFARRVGDEPIGDMDIGHGMTAKGRKDKFIQYYMGAHYENLSKPQIVEVSGVKLGLPPSARLAGLDGDRANRDHGATEILSMGMQFLMRNPSRLAERDPDYFHFLMGALGWGD